MNFGDGRINRVRRRYCSGIGRGDNNRSERDETGFRRRSTSRGSNDNILSLDRHIGIAQTRARTFGRSNNGIRGRNRERSLRDGQESIVGRVLAEAVVYQPEPMVCDSLNLIEIVPLISDPTITPKEIVDVFAMAVTTTLENYRVLVLQLLVLQPLLSFRPHDGLELVPD